MIINDHDSCDRSSSRLKTACPLGGHQVDCEGHRETRWSQASCKHPKLSTEREPSERPARSGTVLWTIDK